MLECSDIKLAHAAKCKVENSPTSFKPREAATVRGSGDVRSGAGTSEAVTVMATTQPGAGPGHKPPKPERRKISLPWFRQASIGEKLTRLRLPRQNTVDSGSPAPATAPPSGPAPHSASSDRLSTFRRKLLSSSASVEVRSYAVLGAEPLLNKCFYMNQNQSNEKFAIPINFSL